MNLFALTPTQEAGGQIVLAVILGAVGFFLLLPRPRGRFVPGGIAAVVASLAVFGAWLHTTFGKPIPDLIGTILFVLFSAGALGFGTVLVVQRSPARGAIAFAFVILSTCGLFLLLAAPFLMAVTIIVYAGAIIVTFLFVLMLSQAEGPSDENDRTREPLVGSLAGFAFVGLVLFTLYQTSQAAGPQEPGSTKPEARLPAPVLTPEEQKTLRDVAVRLEAAAEQLNGDLATAVERNKRVEAFEKAYTPIKHDLTAVVGLSSKEEVGEIRVGTLRGRLEKKSAKPGEPAVLFREDVQARDAVERAARVRELSFQTPRRIAELVNPEKPEVKPDVPAAKAEVRKLRDEVLLLSSISELPARNVSNIGLVLYTDHLLAVELAGTLLLVATIGAVAVAQRKGVAK